MVTKKTVQPRRGDRKTELYKVDFSKLSMADIVDKIAQSHASRAPEKDLYKTTLNLTTSIDDCKNVVECLYRKKKLNKTDAQAMIYALNRMRKISEDVEESEDTNPSFNINGETKYPEDVDGPNIPDTSLDLADEAPDGVEVVSSEEALDDSDLDSSVAAITIDLPEDSETLDVDKMSIGIDDGNLSLDLDLDMGLGEPAPEAPIEEPMPATVDDIPTESYTVTPPENENEEPDEPPVVESTKKKVSPIAKLNEVLKRLDEAYAPVKTGLKLHKSISILESVYKKILKEDDIVAPEDVPEDAPVPATVDELPDTTVVSDIPKSEPVMPVPPTMPETDESPIDIDIDISDDLEADIDITVGSGNSGSEPSADFSADVPQSVDDISPEDMNPEDAIGEEAINDTPEAAASNGTPEQLGDDGDSPVKKESAKSKVKPKTVKREDDEAGVDKVAGVNDVSTETDGEGSEESPEITIDLNITTDEPESPVDSDNGSFDDLDFGDESPIPSEEDEGEVSESTSGKKFDGMLPIAENITSYSPVSSAKKVLEFATAGDTSYNSDVLKKAFLMFEGGNSKDPTNYKFQIGDIVNETLVANPIAVRHMVKFFANNDSLRALAIDEGTVMKIRKKLEAYLGELGDEIPWSRESASIGITNSGKLLKIYRNFDESDASTAIEFMKRKAAK